MIKNYNRFETQVVHAGELTPTVQGAVITPIFQSSTFEYTGQNNYFDLKYLRLNNTPNHEVLHRKLSILEKGEGALVCSSGMAAISTTLFSLLKSGDHLLAQEGLYGGTHHLITEDFSAFNIDCDFIDGNDPDSWESRLRPRTRIIYVEALTNPLLQVANFRAVVEFAKTHNLLALIDSTFLSPVNFHPLELGFDLCLHSGTKYLNGHSDIVAGAIIGSRTLIDKINRRLAHLGGTLDPHACFLFNRGLKTLVVRVKCQNDSALYVAQFLEEHPSVKKVHYPGLKSHSQHERACRLFRGFGGVLSFELRGGVESVKSFMQRITVPFIAPSLGGIETLITLPAVTSHSGLSPETRLDLGISDSLVRLSIGLESKKDLIEDLGQALVN